MNNKLNIGVLILAMVGFLSAFPVLAATSIDGKIFEFTPDNAAQTLKAKPQSWYNPTMGYLGWTHHSNWGYMKLKKGKPVTIQLETAVSGFHPALTVWYRPQKKGYAPVNYVDDHFYNQFKDIYVSNAVVNDNAGNPVNLGKILMQFLANAYDRDGMADALSAAFDQSMLNRTLDGTAGKVSLTFTPKETGVYLFVVGGINPDQSAIDADNTFLSTSHSIDVTVSFPN